tara:strand:- start:14903 stop:16360 length:1458 start_codon:yes stop_codon:yes gene_type:complete
MEEVGTFAKKYIFPIIISFSGLMLLYTAFNRTGNISQSGNFLMGAIIVFLMGIVTFLYIKEIITKKLHIIVLAVMLISCLFLGYSTFSSVTTTISEIELKKEIDINIKQGLRDIELTQLEYKKKYGWYSDDFNELKRFLVEDSVYSISTIGVVPDYKITPEHAEILGYDIIQDYIQIESYDESEALKCGLLKKDTSWINVAQKLFPRSVDSSNKRIFPFEIERLNIVPMSKSKEFKLKADILESSDDVSFEVVLYRKDQKTHFVSANIIDFNGNDKEFYDKNIKGLIVKDSIPQMKGFKINDILLNVNGIVYNDSKEILNLIKDANRDTLLFEIKRKDNLISIPLTRKDIIGKSSRVAWSDLSDLFEYNLLPSFYNPNDFNSLHVGKEAVIKEDEFSSPKLNLEKFKSLLAKRNFDTSNVTFEFSKSSITTYNEVDSEENNFYLLSKIGTPVFTAYDPSPYDPLNERDTLITGSMTEVKTSGNWK